MIEDIIFEKNISKYKLAKNSGIPYSTLNDIISGKTDLKKCSAETLYKLAKALDMPMEDVLFSYFDKRSNFELFKSNVCHELKEQGDIEFIIDIIKKDDIQKYYKRKWFPECFYLLAMLDYISRVNDIPLCNKYDFLRTKSLSKTIYPASIIALATVSDEKKVKKEARENSIPEFIRFNIVESEVRNVI